ncbi:uncharacterized protein B0H64DRAFT_243442 [Chaetomium fimeti]|uniref:Uncharacterized protein n=1 Tax=Chaetomium fimeti TaxID=1854472 RepID=A0AAE0HAG1_9PEZI|nr:hypothetical protein B0H64DRAFT_243442 [Chaetomium fimeti]
MCSDYIMPMSLSQEVIVALVGLIIALPSTCIAFRYCLRRSRERSTNHVHDLEVQIRDFPLPCMTRTLSAPTLTFQASWPSPKRPEPVHLAPSRTVSLQSEEMENFKTPELPQGTTLINSMTEATLNTTQGKTHQVEGGVKLSRTGGSKACTSLNVEMHRNSRL